MVGSRSPDIAGFGKGNEGIQRSFRCYGFRNTGRLPKQNLALCSFMPESLKSRTNRPFSARAYGREIGFRNASRSFTRLLENPD
jgi:hypothetical protein